MSELLNFQCRKKSAFKRIFIIRSGTFNFYEKTFEVVLGIFKNHLNCVNTVFKAKTVLKVPLNFINSYQKIGMPTYQLNLFWIPTCWHPLIFAVGFV